MGSVESETLDDLRGLTRGDPTVEVVVHVVSHVKDMDRRLSGLSKLVVGNGDGLEKSLLWQVKELNASMKPIAEDIGRAKRWGLAIIISLLSAQFGVNSLYKPKIDQEALQILTKTVIEQVVKELPKPQVQEKKPE